MGMYVYDYFDWITLYNLKIGINNGPAYQALKEKNPLSHVKKSKKFLLSKSVYPA